MNERKAMNQKVVSLHGDPLPEPGTPVDQVVAMFEALLIAARSGEIVAAVVVLADPTYAVQWQKAGFVGTYGMVGGIESAKSFILDLFRDEPMDEPQAPDSLA